MTVYGQIKSNKRKTILLVIVFVLFLAVLGFVLGAYYGGDETSAYGGVFFALLVSLGMTSFSYFAGDKVALATSGAKEVQREDHEQLFHIVEKLAITAGLPLPRIHVIPDPALNAFATGRKPETSSIAVTSGLLENLNEQELEGVLAHELSHIQNYDVRLMTIVIVLVGAITLITDMFWRSRLFGGGRRSSDRGGGQTQIVMLVVSLALIVLSPIIAQLIKLAISRKREFLADSSAVLLTRYAEGLQSALQKIGAQSTELRRANHATAHLFFSNPFKKKGRFQRLWSTHPPIEDRIAALAEGANVKM